MKFIKNLQHENNEVIVKETIAEYFPPSEVMWFFSYFYLANINIEVIWRHIEERSAFNCLGSASKYCLLTELREKKEKSEMSNVR